jgi:hypothetical protein
MRFSTRHRDQKQRVQVSPSIGQARNPSSSESTTYPHCRRRRAKRKRALSTSAYRYRTPKGSKTRAVSLRRFPAVRAAQTRQRLFACQTWARRRGGHTRTVFRRPFNLRGPLCSPPCLLMAPSRLRPRREVAMQLPLPEPMRTESTVLWQCRRDDHAGRRLKPPLVRMRCTTSERRPVCMPTSSPQRSAVRRRPR